MADIPLPVPIADIPWKVPMVNILLEVILRNLNDVLRSMENDHRIPAPPPPPPPHGSSFIVRINTLEQAIAAQLRQSLEVIADLGRGEITKYEQHRLMGRQLRDIQASDKKYRKALYDLQSHLVVFNLKQTIVEDQGLDLQFLFDLKNPPYHLEWLVKNNSQRHLKFLDLIPRIRRRDKQRWRRAVRRATCAKASLVLEIRKLIIQAMKYDLICSIEMAQGRSSELSVVSEEDIDVTVIEVMISLFPRGPYLVTSYIDLVSRLYLFDVDPVFQDGDGPWRYSVSSRILSRN